MFPTLFPGGCGGPTESRAINLSVRQWILRCLRVHDHRFEKHHAFMLLAFGYLASQEARQTLYFKMNVKKQALKAENLSRSTLRAAIKYFNYLTVSRAKGNKPRPLSSGVQRVIDLRKGLRVPESAFFGSNVGRMRARHDLFGMLKRFGPMQIFFTISPDSAGTYNIAVKAGVLCRTAIEKANTILVPNRAARKAIAASYPVECAKYFLVVMNTVIDVILGWDREKQAPRRGGGIFGVVRAYGAAAETQRAGDLHAHFVVWLFGFPSTSSGLQEQLTTSTNFVPRLTRFADSVLTAAPPCLLDEVHCPHCHNKDALSSVVPGVDAFRRPPPGSSPPTTSTCSACKTAFKDKDLIDISLEKLAIQQHVQMNAQTSDFDKCRPPAASLNSTMATSLLVRDVQTHYWNHCRSCFKLPVQCWPQKTIRTPKGSICRFLKPEAVHLGPTSIGKDGKLHIHRPIGCEYVNAYHPVVMSTMKCNHDAQFVLSSGAKDTAAYVVKCCFKNQHPVVNQTALSLAAFAKAVNKTNELPVDTTTMERGYQILGSMLYSVTNGQEVAAPMAALYILHATPFWFSHPFVHANLGSMLRQTGDSVEISFSQDVCTREAGTDSGVSHENALEQYWKRSLDLVDITFMEICEKYDRTGDLKMRQVDATLGFVPVVYTKLQSPKVLVFCGDEQPDIGCQLEAPATRFYYIVLLTLFKPHRQSILLPGNNSPLVAYRDFIKSGNPNDVRNLLKFEEQFKDYYKAQRSSDVADESAEAEILRTRAPPTGTYSSCDDPNDHQDVDDPMDETIPNDFLDDESITSPNCSTTKLLQDANNVVMEVPKLQSALAEAGVVYQPVMNFELPSDFSFDSYFSRVVDAKLAAGVNNQFGTEDFISHFQDAPTRLEKLEELFGPVTGLHGSYT